MNTEQYEIESKTRFASSLIWELNRDFYKEKGIGAWSEDIVPHHLTSNSLVGKTYAELIFAFLKDLASKKSDKGIVYILELGAGHGRLAFHILKHLQKLVAPLEGQIPKFCYVLSDIAEDSLKFLSEHNQLQTYYEQGVLDVAYYDAVNGEELHLRKADKTIKTAELDQPIIAIGNYFFDSIPSDLYFVQNNTISDCSISINSEKDPKEMGTDELIKSMEISYHKSIVDFPKENRNVYDEILSEYKKLRSETYLFFPKSSMKCLSNLKALSKAGMVVLTMDKGFHELKKLENMKEPDLIIHGSISVWVNYHALSAYCVKQGGRAMFSSFSNFHLEVGCLMFLEDSETYEQTYIAYDKVVNDFGPDDFNSIKQLAYFNLSRLKLVELIAIYRLSGYDSTMFIKLLPRLKQVKQTITYNERDRLAQSMHRLWDMYFNINENFDLSYELGGIFYDLGFYTDALDYFQYSVDYFGEKVDVSYNQILCHYQLRQDQLFYSNLIKAKALFPDSELLNSLDNLDMG